MAIKREKITRIINGVPSHIQPEHVKRQAVSEIESGQLSLREAMIKYEIKTYAAIRSWINRYSQDENLMKGHATPLAIRRKAVMEIESGALKIKNAARLYNVSESTVSFWLKKYSFGGNSDVPEDMNKVQNNGGDKLIADLRLKVTALETMIDLAEQGYGIEIRKKCGAKQ